MNCQAHHSFLRPHGVRVIVTERVEVLDWRAHTYVPFQRHYKTHKARAMAMRDKQLEYEARQASRDPRADYRFTVEPTERGPWRRCLCAVHNAMYEIDCDRRERRGERIVRAPLPDLPLTRTFA